MFVKSVQCFFFFFEILRKFSTYKREIYCVTKNAFIFYIIWHHFHHFFPLCTLLHYTSGNERSFHKLPIMNRLTVEKFKAIYSWARVFRTTFGHLLVGRHLSSISVFFSTMWINVSAQNVHHPQSLTNKCKKPTVLAVFSCSPNKTGSTTLLTF